MRQIAAASKLPAPPRLPGPRLPRSAEPVRLPPVVLPPNGSSPRLFPRQRAQVAGDGQGSRTQQNNEHAGKDEQDQRKHQLDRGLGSHFLRLLASSFAQVVGKRAQRPRNWSTKAVGLSQHRRKSSNRI